MVMLARWMRSRMSLVKRKDPLASWTRCAWNLVCGFSSLPFNLGSKCYSLSRYLFLFSLSVSLSQSLLRRSRSTKTEKGYFIFVYFFFLCHSPFININKYIYTYICISLSLSIYLSIHPNISQISNLESLLGVIFV